MADNNDEILEVTPEPVADPDVDIDETDDNSPATYKPPTRAEWIKLQASLVRANSSAKERRLKIRELEKVIQDAETAKAQREAQAELAALQKPADSLDIDSKKGKKSTPVPGPPPLPPGVMTPAQVKLELEKARRDAEETAQTKYRDIAVKSAATVALAQAGVQAGNLGRITRLLDLEEISLDDDGQIVEGLDEQIEALRAELPALFKSEPDTKTTKAKPRVPRVTAANQPQAAEPKKTTAQQIADLALGGRL